jgi:diguanylate cyclase (GGDEF)-like protein
VVRGRGVYFSLSINQALHVWDLEHRPDLPIHSLPLKVIPSFSKELSIFDALEILQFNFEEILATEEDGSIYGILTFTDILTSIDPETFMGNFRLDHILKVTRRIPWLSPDLSTREVLNRMEQYDHSSVILTEDRRPIGIVTSKDMLRILMRKYDLTLPIREYMTQPVLTLHHETTIAETLDFLKKNRFKRAVAVDDEGWIVGVFTQKEIVAFTYHRWMQIIKKQQEKLDQINKVLLRQNLEIEKASSIDPLTSLYNRLKCNELFISEYTVMLQRHNIMSLILMDLDHFKTINDTCGHNTGDRVLKEVSHILSRNLRNVDIACRWGGEEFIIILPASNLHDSMRRAEHLRKEIAQIRLPELPLSLTASFGVTEVHPGQSLEEVIEQADRALYRAKDLGRNRVVGYPETPDRETAAST